MTVHGFCHTHASILFETGASSKQVQERLGHSDIKTTMNVYAHVPKHTKKDTVDKFMTTRNKQYIILQQQGLIY
ncbi:integrase [Lactiplantibacillus pentosus]|nr:integrase [Lactiplantibacillus pentosus]